MAQYLSQFNSLLGSWATQTNNQSNSRQKQFRPKILDLYDAIFIQHKQIKTLECNFLHLKVHRNGLYQSVRNAINSQQYNEQQIILLFNKTFQHCINSLLDDKLLIVQHAFQSMSVMLISIAKCNRYLSVSDIVTYMCQFEQFDKYFEIIEERISNTMLSLNELNCKIAALEFTLSIMTISGNIHSNLFTEQLLLNQFHKILFKYLKYQIKEMHQQYQNTNNEHNNPNELIITHEEKKQNDDNSQQKNNPQTDTNDNTKQQEYILQHLKDKQHLLMLILTNITILSHYQRFESDNIALKYISTLKIQPTKHFNTVIVSLAQHTIKQYRQLFPETRMHQIGNYVQSISGFFSSTIMGHNNEDNSKYLVDTAASSTATSRSSTAPSSPSTETNEISDNLLANLTYCSSILLLCIYNNVSFNNPGWMVHSAGLRKSNPDEITKHPLVVVSPDECPSILTYFICLSSCIFQLQMLQESKKKHEELTRLSLIIYSRLTEIPACLIVLFSTDFKIDPRLSYAHKERNNIIWKEMKQQPLIAILFDIWCDYIQNIGKNITQYHEQLNIANNEKKEDQLSDPLYSSSTLFCLRILLDIFIRCMIFQNEMELFFAKSLFYLRLMKILMNLMKLFLVYIKSHFNETLFDIICRIIVTMRMMIGCCENIFENKENYIISFFLELARYSDTFKEFNEIIHDEDAQNGRENNKFCERLKKDSRVVVRVSKFFEDAITLEFPEWKTSNIQTPLHHSRALQLVRETLKCDEFEIPPPKLNGQYLGYQETNKREIKFFNDIIKKNIATVFTKKCLS